MIRNKYFTCGWLILLSILLVSCGDDDDNTPTGNGGTNPVVISTSPPYGAIGVAIDVSITATFSEDMDSSTVNAATFLISHGVTGTITYSNRVATFTPAANLMQDTTYSAIITTGVRSAAGKVMLSNYEWVFTVGGAAVDTFSTKDLEGQWEFRGLGVGYSDMDNFWAIGRIDIAANGLASLLSSEYSDDRISAPFDGMIMALDSNGILSAVSSDLHGIMDYAKSMIVATGTDIIGELDLIVLTKKEGAIYSPGDLNGTWDFHSLVSGWPPDWTGWAYGALEINSDSNLAFTSIIRSDGNTSVPPPGIVKITENGIVTIPNLEFHGIMNPEKDIITVTSTDQGGGGNVFMFITKRSGVTFSLSDLFGGWMIHGLTSGDIGDYKGWGYSTALIDGNGDITFISEMRWNGDTTTYPGQVNVSVSPVGIINATGMEDFHGVITARKDKWIGIMSDGGGGYGLGIAMRRIGGICF